MKRPLPEWATREYGGYGTAWWEAIDQCRAILIGWARDGALKTYTELSDQISAIPWPEGAHTHEGSQIGWLLGQVAVAEWAEGRPLLSAIVISASTKRPSYGFYDLAMQLGEIPAGASSERQEEYWVVEVAKCFSESGYD